MPVDTSHREFKAYSVKSGDIVGFDTAIDLHQAQAMGHVTLCKPGGASAESLPDPMRAYEKMSSDDVRKLCVSRGIVGYLTMPLEKQIAALRERDKQEQDRALAGAEALRERGAREKKLV